MNFAHLPRALSTQAAATPLKSFLSLLITRHCQQCSEQFCGEVLIVAQVRACKQTRFMIMVNHVMNTLRA